MEQLEHETTWDANGEPRQLHGWWAASICIPGMNRENPGSFIDGGLQVSVYLGRLGKPRQLHGWWATSICIPRTSREKPSSFMDGGLQVYAYLGRLGGRQAASWMVGYIGILVQNLHMYLNTANLKQQNIP